MVVTRKIYIEFCEEKKVSRRWSQIEKTQMLAEKDQRKSVRKNISSRKYAQISIADGRRKGSA